MQDEYFAFGSGSDDDSDSDGERGRRNQEQKQEEQGIVNQLDSFIQDSSSNQFKNQWEQWKGQVNYFFSREQFDGLQQRQRLISYSSLA